VFAYLSLFVVAFVAATLLPASSEALLLSLRQQGYLLWALWLAATAGNTLGSCVNWWLGREILRFQHRRWFPVDEKKLERASGQFARFGSWSLLFAWLPIVGDPLTFVAGILRIRFDLFLLLVATGKAARYALVLMIGHSLLGISA
tara:strand:- start:87242 stop:87679 length:438 start_codon:yes stop_codon:yes gene_type:complete